MVIDSLSFNCLQRKSNAENIILVTDILEEPSVAAGGTYLRFKLF